MSAAIPVEIRLHTEVDAQIGVSTDPIRTANDQVFSGLPAASTCSTSYNTPFEMRHLVGDKSTSTLNLTGSPEYGLSIRWNADYHIYNGSTFFRSSGYARVDYTFDLTEPFLLPKGDYPPPVGFWGFTNSGPYASSSTHFSRDGADVAFSGLLEPGRYTASFSFGSFTVMSTAKPVEYWRGLAIPIVPEPCSLGALVLGCGLMLARRFRQSIVRAR